MHLMLFTFLPAVVIEGFAVTAAITWFYNTTLLAELMNILPGKRPRFYLRRDVEEWLPSSSVPVLLQTLLTCSRCGHAHASFWLGLPHVCWLWQADKPWLSMALMLLFWAGSAGISLKLRNDL
jgi:hypothetical protein